MTLNVKRPGKLEICFIARSVMILIYCERRYWSDYKDALSLQCIAAFTFLYFACLTPCITFGGLLGDATENRLGTMESLCSGFLCGVVYGIFAGQPLTILGSTGPVLVFETILFNFCK
jgi:solute carrier family 4 (sodium bicarbonate transporter), member 10